ncbi:MAG: hypothetical protein H7Z16_03360 [Pyrinomonadaceae bacterium]|nr:hypothetical protein [Pyrinomonadaceae bacterium]
MKPRTIPRLHVLGLIVFSLLLTACPQDNPNDPLRKYAKAVDNMAGAINSMIKAKRSLASNGRISPAEDLTLTKALLVANEAVTVFHTRVKSLTVAPDASTKAELITMLNNVTTAIDNLNSQGVIGVSNADSKSKLARFIATIKAAIAVFSSL